jgi:hypothetical protein
LPGVAGRRSLAAGRSLRPAENCKKSENTGDLQGEIEPKYNMTD